MIQHLQKLIDYLFCYFKELLEKLITSLCTKYQNKRCQCLIDGKRFLNLPVKHDEEAYETIMDMSNNNDFTTGNLLDFAYLKKNTD